MGAGKTSESTHERLLDAAGKAFADKGYRAATVREICGLAGANVAAVNYHFGSKRKLYAEVLSSIFRYAMGRYPPDLGQDEATTPAERLYAFVRAFLLRLLDPEKPAWHRRLLAREMREPSPMMRGVIEKRIRRSHELLHEILTELLGARATPCHMELCVASITAQCLFYQRRRHMVWRALRHVKVSPEGVEALARHITEFSLYGVMGGEDRR